MPVLLPQTPRIQSNYRHRQYYHQRHQPLVAPTRRIGTTIDQRTKAGVVPESIEWLGQGIVYFTMFYCSINWFYYRNLRKDLEKFKEDQEAKKAKKTTPATQTTQTTQATKEEDKK